NRIALHESKKPFQPMWQPLAILPMNYRFVPHVISHVVKADLAAVSMCLPQKCRNIRTLHESVASAGTPHVRCDLVDREPCGAFDPRHRLRLDSQYEQTFVQCPVMFQVPDQYRWGVALRTCQENSGPRYPRNLRLLNLRHEKLDWHDGLMQALGHCRRSHVPDHHDEINAAREQERYVSSFGDLRKIGGEKGRVYD